MCSRCDIGWVISIFDWNMHLYDLQRCSWSCVKYNYHNLELVAGVVKIIVLLQTKHICKIGFKKTTSKRFIKMANDGTISFPTGSTNPEDRLNFLPLPPSICGETEELFPKEERLEFTTKEIIVVSVRCVIAFLCLIGTILVIVVTARSRQQRYKSWRLYILTSLMVLAWMCMSLYRGIYKQNCTILDEESLLELFIQKLT